MKSLLLFLLGYRISTWCLMKFNFTFNTCEIRMIMSFFSSRISIPWDKLMSGWNTSFIRVSFQIHNDWRMYMFVCTCVWVYVNVCVYLYIACACVFCVCMFHVCMYVYVCICLWPWGYSICQNLSDLLIDSITFALSSQCVL